MRDGSTYRGARRNACLRTKPKGVWGIAFLYEGFMGYGPSWLLRRKRRRA